MSKYFFSNKEKETEYLLDKEERDLDQSQVAYVEKHNGACTKGCQQPDCHHAEGNRKFFVFYVMKPRTFSDKDLGKCWQKPPAWVSRKGCSPAPFQAYVRDWYAKNEASKSSASSESSDWGDSDDAGDNGGRVSPRELVGGLVSPRDGSPVDWNAVNALMWTNALAHADAKMLAESAARFNAKEAAAEAITAYQVLCDKDNARQANIAKDKLNQEKNDAYNLKRREQRKILRASKKQAKQQANVLQDVNVDSDGSFNYDNFELQMDPDSNFNDSDLELQMDHEGEPAAATTAAAPQAKQLSRREQLDLNNLIAKCDAMKRANIAAAMSLLPVKSAKKLTYNVMVRHGNGPWQNIESSDESRPGPGGFWPPAAAAGAAVTESVANEQGCVWHEYRASVVDNVATDITEMEDNVDAVRDFINDSLHSQMNDEFGDAVDAIENFSGDDSPQDDDEAGMDCD